MKLHVTVAGPGATSVTLVPVKQLLQQPSPCGQIPTFLKPLNVAAEQHDAPSQPSLNLHAKHAGPWLNTWASVVCTTPGPVPVASIR
jgi:hypothetical protein